MSTAAPSVRAVRPLDPPTLVATGLLGTVAAFQVALAGGAPWGAAAWGGAYAGVLPPGMRLASAVSASVYVLLAATLLSSRVPPRTRRRVLAVACGLLVVGTLMNLASPSGVERAIWAPVAAALAVSLWLARRRTEA